MGVAGGNRLGCDAVPAVAGVRYHHATVLADHIVDLRDEVAVVVVGLLSNVIVNPDLYEKYRRVINREKFLRVEGVLQNQDHTISIKAVRVLPVSVTAAETQSHGFH